MKKFCFSLLCLFLSFVSYAQEYSGGDGTEESPFLIKTEADLQQLATSVNGGNNYADKFIKLDADIACSGTYSAIGNKTKKFNGTFDGAGHVLSGFTMTGSSYTGLFGSADTKAVIKNLTLSSPNVTINGSYGAILVAVCEGVVENCHIDNCVLTTTTGSFTGGFIGQLKGGTVKDCSLTGSITTMTPMGCIVGQNGGKILGCNSSATIVSLKEASATTHLGGIAAITLSLVNTVEPEISDCYFTGNITGNQHNNCAGISATFNSAKMSRCWSAAYITGFGSNSICGGLIGTCDSGSVTDCYSASTLYNEETTKIGGLVGTLTSASTSFSLSNSIVYGSIYNSILSRNDGCEFIGFNQSKLNDCVTNCYFDKQVSGNSSKTNASGLYTLEMTGATPLTGFSTETWAFENGKYPRLKYAMNNETAHLYSVPVFYSNNERQEGVRSSFVLGSDNDVEWDLTDSDLATLDGNNVTVTRGNTLESVVLTSYLGESTKRNLIKIYPNIFNGAGTQDDPYLISNYADLEKLANATNESAITFEGEYFKVTDDIDMQYKEMAPIASAKFYYAFAGTFDGNNKTIKNYAMDNSVSKTLNVGLFKTVSKEGVIKNLKFAATDSLKIYRNFAPFVCTLYGTVENCYNYASFASSDGYCGGVVYQIENTGVVRGCFNAGNITAVSKGNIGGIADSNRGLIENCINVGTIDAKGDGYCAGIVSYNASTLKNVMNAGLIIGKTKAGGICGSETSGSEISSVLSIAPVVSVNGYELVGALVGAPLNYTTLSEAYFDNQIAIFDGSRKEAGSKTTAELLNADNLFTDASLWSYKAGQYPILKSFENEPIAQFYTVPVVIANNERRDQLNDNVTLPAVDGAEWSLLNNKTFKIENSKLMIGENEGFVCDTIKCAKAKLERLIPVSTLGNFLEGLGTVEAPYLIKTSADLAKLSEQVLASNNSYKGKNFKVTNDIDMTGVAFSPIAPNNNVKFEGILDGGNFALKGLSVKGADYVGLFGRLGLYAEVNNLVIDDKSTFSGTTNVGSIAGYSEGLISNCINNASVNPSSSFGGGIVGSVIGGSKILNCINNGNVASTKDCAAGIVGCCGNLTTPALVYNCKNTAKVNGTTKIGGIVGNVKLADVVKCQNLGAVTGTSSYTGGIIGQADNNSVCDSLVNLGTVNGKSEVGGLVGYTAKYLTLQNSYNAAPVSGTASNVAGLIGKGDANVISKCFNTGDIKSTATTVSSSAAGAAGLVGVGVPTMTDCYNAGSVTALKYVGGILGQASSSYTAFELNNVYSLGKVTATGVNVAEVGAIMSKAASKLTASNVCYDAEINNTIKAVAGTDTYTALTTRALTFTDMGENWTSYPNHYPVLTEFAENPQALVYSAAVVLDEPDTYDSVTKGFAVGVAGGVEWTGDNVFTFDNGNVSVKPYTDGTYTIKASLDNVEKSMTLTLKVGSGVEMTTNNEAKYVVVAGGVQFNENCKYELYNLNGSLVYSGNATVGEVISVKQGLYVVSVDGKGTVDDIK